MSRKQLRALLEKRAALRLGRDVTFILAAAPPIVLARWIKEVR